MLQDVMQKHGLGKVDENDAFRIMDAVRGRGEGMRIASEETKERESGYEGVKALREERMAESAPEGAAVQQTAGESEPRSQESATWTYTRRGLGSTALTDIRSTGFRRSL